MITKYLIIIIVLLCSIIILGFLARSMSDSLKKYERMECLEWQRQSLKYDNWYSTNWQKEQCKQFDIIFEK
jgi:hypothetical protein